MKILNLYAGLGGNRRLWPNTDQVTAVELDGDIAAYYKDRYPEDKLVIGDAHQYLINHYQEYDFIWTSPPCQSHSSFRFNIGVRYRGVKPIYPDMSLWQEILLLQSHYQGNWVVENVKPYYKPLIKPTVELQRHLFWSNKPIKQAEFKSDSIRNSQIPHLQDHHQINLKGYKITNKRQALRNCVESHLGRYVRDEVINGD
jgi:DNA (cytosine-5)-methyltransferase 1